MRPRSIPIEASERRVERRDATTPDGHEQRQAGGIARCAALLVSRTATSGARGPAVRRPLTEKHSAFARCARRSVIVGRTTKAATSNQAWLSACGDCRLSISRPVNSRSITRTRRSGSYSTARSTTTPSFAASSKTWDIASIRPATRKRSCTRTKNGARTRSCGCAACLGLRCGTAARRRSSSPAIESASSRCTTRSNAIACTSDPRSNPSSPPGKARRASMSRRSTTICPISTRRATDRSSRASANCRPAICCAGKTAGSRYVATGRFR